MALLRRLTVSSSSSSSEQGTRSQDFSKHNEGSTSTQGDDAEIKENILNRVQVKSPLLEHIPDLDKVPLQHLNCTFGVVTRMQEQRTLEQAVKKEIKIVKKQYNPKQPKYLTPTSLSEMTATHRVAALPDDVVTIVFAVRRPG